MKIRLLGVKYSDNLGDGVIAECLEAELRRQLPGADVGSVDLSSKTDFGGHGLGGGSSVALRVTRLMPGGVRSLLRSLMHWMAAHWMMPGKWHPELAGSDRVIVGGGQLFQDAEFYFPARIRAALRRSTPDRCRVLVYGVGVNSTMRWPGRRVFRGILARVAAGHIWVRDELSVRFMRELLGVPQARRCRDPALLCGEHYAPPPTPLEAEGRTCIGICLSDPHDLRPRIEWDADASQPAAPFHVALIQSLLEQGYRCRVYTAGAASDQAFAAHVLEQLQDRLAPDADLVVEPRPTRPADLVAITARCHALIGVRMHPNIIAYALRIPSVGLAATSKLSGFLQSVGREAYEVSLDRLTVAEVLGRLEEALVEGVPAARHAEVVAEARAGVEALARAVSNGADDAADVARAAEG